MEHNPVIPQKPEKNGDSHRCPRASGVVAARGAARALGTAEPVPRFSQKPEPERDQPQGDDREPMLYCPVCDARLSELKCKLVCDRCGYYMSCADYY